MARPGLDRHPKFRTLCRLLGEPRPHVWGYLEMLWQAAYENGEPVIGSALQVEAVAEFPGKSGLLAESLATCGGPGRAGFIEPVAGKPELFQIHNLFQNAPEYVTLRADREAERQRPKKCEACGREFHSPDTRAKYCAPGCRVGAWRNRQTVPDCNGEKRNETLNVTDVTDRNGTPAPSSQHPHSNTKSARAGIETGVSFDRFWKAYPRKLAKEAARKAWGKIDPDGDLIKTIVQAVKRQSKSEQWQRDGGKFIPYPATWLNGRRWEDEAEQATELDADGTPTIHLTLEQLREKGLLATEGGAK